MSGHIRAMASPTPPALLPALLLTVLLLPGPAAAQDDAPEVPFADELFDEFLRGTEDALRQFLDEVQPDLETLLRQIGRLPSYHTPEILPNGDILIRRRQPAAPRPQPDATPRTPPPPAAPQGPIEL